MKCVLPAIYAVDICFFFILFNYAYQLSHYAQIDKTVIITCYELRHTGLDIEVLLYVLTYV